MKRFQRTVLDEVWDYNPGLWPTTQSLLLSTESAGCPVIPVTRLKNWAEVLLWRCPEAILTPNKWDCARLEQDIEEVGVWGLGEVWCCCLQKSDECRPTRSLAGVAALVTGFDWVPHGEEESLMKRMWWPLIHTMMDGERDCSICHACQYRRSRALERGVLKHRVYSKKHLGVKSQNDVKLKKGQNRPKN